ncbi:MAG: polymerase sigma-70 factor, subfamily [Devosia sp.]|nr:polymerase sigma-70 factor, subfamily [Devosia sp.]
MLTATMSQIPPQPPTGPLPADDLAKLIERVATLRDREALAKLFDIFAPKLKAIMLRHGANSAMAEDLAQETLLVVWRKAHLYSAQRGAVSTWIFTIARNLRIDHLRRQSNRPYEDLEGVEIASDAPGGDRIVEENQIVDRVTLAIRTLSKEQQDVVRLSFIEDIPHSEIATRVGIPLGTVKSRLRLAYERLRPMLEDLQ